MGFRFLPVATVASAMATWQGALRGRVGPVDAVEVGLAAALGRVLAFAVTAAEDVPGFDRSTVDGYAVRAADTFGASEALPAYFDVTGAVPMGAAAPRPLPVGAAAPIATGGMLPPGADAAVMAEYCELLPDGQLAVNRPAGPGENVISRGEDVRAGDAVLRAGHAVRPQDLGVLAAVGAGRVVVRRRPRVAILSTGDELVGVEARPGPGQVRDINAHALVGMVEQAGGEALPGGIVPDDPEQLARRAAAALAGADMLIISGGSSIGSRDYVGQAIDSLGEPGVLVHGIAMRPGKPTVLALADGRPVLGLPGHPASALVVFWLFGLPALAHLAGVPAGGGAPRVQPAVRARLVRNLASAPGREDYYRAALIWDEPAGEWRAEPVFGKSGLVSTLVRGDGLVRVPAEEDGLAAGEMVEVVLFGWR
ncbi:MAG: molybdopterin molybdotransferase MoeA [Bacillota bacterium]|nr:molybdopterin molybdotransferase MoeA [Bacillota bacterium]